jgi:hypothetical protein
MTRKRILNYLIAAVWIANGLFCKVLNLVPRHQEIVARIIGNAHAGIITRAIGFSEVTMAVWIISGIKTKLNAVTQTVIIAMMNSLEFILAVAKCFRWTVCGIWRPFCRKIALSAFINPILLTGNTSTLSKKEGLWFTTLGCLLATRIRQTFRQNWEYKWTPSHNHSSSR